MKNLKIACFFFCICTLFLIHSCSKKAAIEKGGNPLVDSVDVFIFNMENENLDLKTRLKHANKALQKATFHKLDSRIYEILNHKIYLLGSLKKYDSAIYTSKELLQKSIEKNDSIFIGKAYYNLAYYYNMNNQKDSAYYHYNLSKNVFIKLKDSTQAGASLLSMAIIESAFGDYNGSEYTGTLALKYFDDKNPDYTASVYNNWAISSKKRGEYKDALIFYEKAINLTTSKENKIIFKNNIASTYRYLGDYDKSIKILERLNKDTLMDAFTKARVLDNLAYSKWLANKKEPVLSDLLEALAIRQRENDLNGLIASYAHLSEYYKKKNSKTALLYAHKMFQLSNNQKSSQDRLEALQKLIELDNTSEAKVYYNDYVRINDSLQKAEQKAKNKFAKTKYNSEKNREENLSLKIIASAKEIELEKEKNRNLIGAVSSSSILFGLLIFGYFRKQKYKLEKLQEVYKTETRIAKKIHDEVANDLVNIMNKVQYTEEPKESLLDNLEKVYLLTRNISHQSNTIETGNKFVDSLKSLLTSFNNNTTTIILKNIKDVKLETMTKDKQIEIYRVLQELMVNMQKHSEASLVAISFKNIKNQYFINYSDNGVGLEFDNLTLKSGLKNVETRIKSINGIINFESSSNKGFKVIISFKK